MLVQRNCTGMGQPPKNRKPAANQKRKLRNLMTAADYAVYEPPNKDQLQIARVYVNYGVESGVELNGVLKRLANRRNLPTVAGDLVYTDGNVVEGILPRGKVLARYADEGGIRLIASNLTQVGLVISASKPTTHVGLIDRYLTFCRIADIPLFLVVNKIDELEPGFVEGLKPFVDAGVDLYLTSATTDKGLKALARRLERGITVLSGLSGVGKSTLINALLEEEIPTQEVSGATGRGRHTTTAAEAYEFGKTLLIDSPGIKKFGFIGVGREEVLKGFPEFEPYLGHCHFDNCEHTIEEGCAVRAAVEAGEIDERRWESYTELLDNLNQSE
ncbi:ribosome small subunit-dependent GTPase A [bacterium]|nr:ribosome small subunit-dependent GTPase A [bacterium]